MTPILLDATCPRPSRTRRVTFLALLLVALAAPAGMTTAVESRQPYIVVLNDDDSPDRFVGFRQLAQATTQRREERERTVEHISRVARNHRLGVTDVYTSAVRGFSAELTPAQIQGLTHDPSVSAVIPDVPIQLDRATADLEAGSVRTTTNPTTRVQPGIKRVGARTSRVLGFAGRDSRIDADVAILDSGVEPGHPDLNVVGGYNCTGRDRDKWDDRMGHGTHVAGIVGALDNRIGVTGVAPGVRIWSVKILDRNGKGFLSWMVCGVDWVTAQRQPRNPNRSLIEVANMSISFNLPGADDRDCGRPSNDTLHMAICRSVARGTVYVVAAGNNSYNAGRNRPGAYQEVITVSAMADYDGRGGARARPSDSCPYWSPEPDDAFTSFSNWGPDVDLIAPGKCILSTYPGGRYAWMSGTSMATPHVSGAAAIYRAMFPRATPAQARLALQAIGTLDWRTETDPDRYPERAVWIGNFRVAPDYAMSTDSFAGTVAPGRRLAIPVFLVRIGGFSDRVTITLANPPAGFSAGRVVTQRNSATLHVDIDGQTRSRHFNLTLVARSGELERSVPVSVQVRSIKPKAAFFSPVDGLTVQSSTNVFVSWTESSRTDIASRRLDRQVGRIRRPGTCDGVNYTTDATSRHAGSGTSRTRSGYCYRWKLTLVDQSGPSVTAYSGSVLVDTSAPRAPSIRLAGKEIGLNLDRLGVDDTHIDRRGTLWVRGNARGSVDLDVSALDSQSGIARTEAVVRGGNSWGVRWIGSSAEGRLRLFFTPGGGAGELRVGTVNGAGLKSGVTVARLMRDTARPNAVTWVSAPSGTTQRTHSTRFRLDWRGGADQGAGLSRVHIVRRYRAPLNRNGTFPPLGFTQDGSFDMASDRTLETDLKPGYCYVWSVRTLDNVGNYAPAAISGYVVVEKR